MAWPPVNKTAYEAGFESSDSKSVEERGQSLRILWFIVLFQLPPTQNWSQWAGSFKWFALHCIQEARKGTSLVIQWLRLRFQCRGHRFDPWLGNMLHGTAKKEKRAMKVRKALSRQDSLRIPQCRLPVLNSCARIRGVRCYMTHTVHVGPSIALSHDVWVHGMFPQKFHARVLSCSIVSNSLRSHRLYLARLPSIHGIFQARILGWVAICSRGSAWPWDRTRVSCIGRQILYHWVIWESPQKFHRLRQFYRPLLFPAIVNFTFVTLAGSFTFTSIITKADFTSFSQCFNFLPEW